MDSCVNYSARRSYVNGVMCPLNKLLSHTLELLARSGVRASIVFFVIGQRRYTKPQKRPHIDRLQRSSRTR